MKEKNKIIAELTEQIEILGNKLVFEIIENKEYEQETKRNKIKEKNDIMKEIYKLLKELNQ